MMLMYVDESGDVGAFIPNHSSNSPHFILSGLIISQEEWLSYLQNIKTFRKHIKTQYGLLLKEEIHAAELIRVTKIKAYKQIHKSDRLMILKSFVQQMPAMLPNAKIINISLDKTQFPPDTDFMELAWKRLIQRYDNFLKKSVNDKGIIVADDTNSDLIRNIMRKMRVYNPVPSLYSGTYQAPTDNILEDPFTRDSKHSYFIQAVDCIAQALYRKEFPKGSLKKYGIDKFFDYLEPILLKDANRKDANGIVRK